MAKNKILDSIASKSLLERIFDNTHTLIACLDTSFNFIHVNQAYLDADNKSLTEVLGKNHFDLYPNDENQKIFQQVLDTGEIYYANARAFQYGRNPERGITHWNWSLQPIKEDNKVIALLLVLVDVTEQISAQEALIRNEEAMNSAQAISHFGSWDWNILTGELGWSDEIYRILGYEPQSFQATYESFVESIHPDDREAVTLAVSACVEDASVAYDIEHRLVRADGEILHIHEKGEVYRDGDGQPIRMLGVAHDVTEQKHSEEALRSSIELNKTIIANSPVGMAIYEKTGRCIAANQSIANMIGATLEEVLKQNYHEIQSWKKSGLYGVAQEVLAKNTTERQEFTVNTSFGKEVSIEVYVSRFENKGKPHLLLMLNDITERRQIMDELTQHKLNLETLVSDRTQELQDALQQIKQENDERKRIELSLIQAKNDAELANSLKSEFLGRMSHELRTPMNAILGFSQLLETEGLDETQADFVKEISSAGRHLLELINEVLDLSKIESGKFEVNIEYMPLGEIVLESLSMVHPMAAEKNIIIENLIDPASEILLQADRLRCKEVLVNLLSNAVKYNHPRGRVTVNSQMTGEGVIRINVTDNGPGISPEQQQLVFEPFNRLGSEYTEIEGTGIGLTIAHQLMQKMDGKIGVHSTPGEGSTFWLEFAVAEGTGNFEPSMNQLTEPAAPLSSNQTVLYVEDNQANQRLVQQIFSRLENVELYSCANAEIGIELAKAKQPDLILLDINLPGMDGYEALSRLRNIPVTRDIPVFAISAAAMPRDIQRGIAAGFKCYITKPLQVADLLESIRDVLGSDLNKPLARR